MHQLFGEEEYLEQLGKDKITDQFHFILFHSVISMQRRLLLHKPT